MADRRECLGRWDQIRSTMQGLPWTKLLRWSGIALFLMFFLAANFLQGYTGQFLFDLQVKQLSYGSTPEEAGRYLSGLTFGFWIFFTVHIISGIYVVVTCFWKIPGSRALWVLCLMWISYIASLIFLVVAAMINDTLKDLETHAEQYNLYHSLINYVPYYFLALAVALALVMLSLERPSSIISPCNILQTILFAVSVLLTLVISARLMSILSEQTTEAVRKNPKYIVKMDEFDIYILTVSLLNFILAPPLFLVDLGLALIGNKRCSFLVRFINGLFMLVLSGISISIEIRLMLQGKADEHALIGANMLVIVFLVGYGISRLVLFLCRPNPIREDQSAAQDSHPVGNGMELNHIADGFHPKPTNYEN